MTAAVVVRSMLGVSPSAYEEACGIVGPETAASIVACILERGGHINSAGGYRRDLTRRADRLSIRDSPLRVPGDLPKVAVGIMEVAGVTAPEAVVWAIGNGRAGVFGLFHDRIDLLL